MRWVTALALLACLLCLGGSAEAICGDVNGNAAVSPGDLLYLLTYLADPSQIPSLPNPGDADMDDRTGITAADMAALMNYLFGPFDLPDCSPSQSYSLTASPDSVYFPQMPVVPDGVDTVDLPVITVLGADTRVLYLPFLKQAPGTSNFSLNRIVWSSGTYVNYPTGGNVGPDTVCIQAGAINWPNPNFTGRQTMLKLRYIRTAPGAGSIAPVLVDRSSLWRPSVVKNQDLFLPNIQYYNYAFPPETLKVSLNAMSFDAVAGYPSADSFVVSFTSSGLPISFELTATESWITIVDTGAIGFRTPASVVIKADATSTGIGNYTGQISFSSLNPSAPTTIPYVDVSLAVRAPNIYPFGDLDCDGVVDIGDLTKIIDHLYMSLNPLTPCQP
jgi:hypothetical protein